MSYNVVRGTLRSFWIALVGVLLSVAAFPIASAAQPTPITTFSGVPPQSFIGEPLTFTVSFDNTSPTAAGYGPYIDLVLPATGADGAGPSTDDGISFIGATYLGAPVTATVLTFNASGQATHPYARDASGTPIVVTGTPGDQLVVLQLPFGSFTPDQPPVDVLVTTSLSNLADVSSALTLSARGGFQYGADALDNPSTDPSIIGNVATIATTPTVLRLKKTYIGPEDETATGPNFPRQYLIEVDIANGQTLTNLDLTDILPPTLQFVSVDATTIRGTPTATTSIATPSTTTPGGTLTRRFASVTGTTATNDATMLFTFYVPRTSATSTPVLDANTGDDAQSVDDAKTQGTWAPIDGRDAPGLSASDITPSDHTLTDKSIAIQKSVAIVTDTGATGATPGDVLEYTLNVQVSDFFAFRNLVLTDVLSDGLHQDPSFTPTLRVTQHGNTTSGNMTGGNYGFVLDSPGTGHTTGTFNVSNELIARALDGNLIGGCVPDGGTGGPVPDCTLFNGGATTLTLVYRAIIQNNYTDNFPSGDSSVDQGDVLSNNVTALADVLSDATLLPTGSNEADDSAANVAIQRGQLFKTIYAINGNTSFPTPVKIGPGDTITYQLRLTLPTSDIEPLTITDYLPLPILDATTVTSFNATVSAAAPPSGQAKFGPSDTFFALSGITPTLSTDATSNSVAWTYAQFDSASSPSTTIDLLFTVTATNDPFADGLFLTNQVKAAQSSTQLDPLEAKAIVQIQLTEPDIHITKGVVATDAPTGVFSPATVGPVSFSAPGSAGYRGGGTITSTNLGTSPIHSNLTGVDAGDLVTFAIVLENRGNGIHGAYDIRIRDTLPAGFVIPATGALLNLRVTDGTGAALPFTNVGTGLFDPAGGIELTDTAEGALAAFDPTNGHNIAIVTFDLEAASTVTPTQAITNTATLLNFAGTSGGPDFTSTDRTASATVTTATPAVTKTIVSTNQAHTSGNNVAIGEQVQYQVVVRVPEGDANNFKIVDTLPAGLAVVSLDGLSASSGALSSSSGAFSSILSSAVVAAVGGGADNAGRQVTLDFGTLTNSDRDNSTAETITLLFTAVVINGGSNDRGDTRTNSASVTYTGGSASGNSPAVTIVEPTLQIINTAAPTVGDAGDTITFTIMLSHAVGSNADAFEVLLADGLPAGLTFVSATPTGGVAPTSFTPGGGGFTATFTSFPLGSTSTFQITATLDGTLTSGQVLTNSAASQWSSLPGVVTSPQSPFNTVSTERTGNTGNPGGVENDYVATGSATVTGLAAASTKSIITTSLPTTVGNNVAIGERVQYQVQIVVPEGTSANATLVDTLDPGLAFYSFDSLTASSGSVTTDVPGGFPAVLANRVVSNVGGGLPNDGRRVTFNVGNVTNSDTNNATLETLTFVYTAIVIDTAANVRGQTRHNVAAWTSGGAPVNASAPDVTIVEPTLQIQKTAAPTIGDAGSTITFTLTVSHTAASNEDAYDVALTDTLPAGLTYVVGSQSFTGVTPSSVIVTPGSLTLGYATLALGQTSVITIQATLNSAPPVTPGATLTNTASIVWSSLPGTVNTAQSPFNTMSTERDGSGGVNNYTANGTRDVTVASSQISGFVYLDGNNDGVKGGAEPGIAGVTVQLTGTDHLGNPVVMTTTTAGNGSYAFTGLRAGTYTVTESQPGGYADGLDTVGTPALGATAGNDTLGTITLPPATNTTATDFNFGELSSADLSITKIDDPDPVLPGANVTYTIDARNAGPNPALNALLTDPLPGGTTFVSLVAPGGWSCTTPAAGATGVVSCSSASFPAFSNTVFTLTVQADAGLAAHSLLRNVATITSGSVDTNPSNNQAEATTIVAALTDADLEVTKTHSPATVSIGQTVSFTIIVRNHGPAVTDATVTDPMPSALAGISATTPGGTCSIAAGPITCSIPGLASGATAIITVQATALTSGAATNTVSVTGTAPDPNPDNNSASDPIAISDPGGTDLSITKTGPITVARGAPLTYTLVITNNGPNLAAGLTVDDPLSLPGLTFVSNNGACTTPFPCTFGPLGSGASLTIVSTYTVSAAYAGPNPIVNTATVSASLPTVDANPANNSATAQTLVADAATADLTITKVDSPDATVAGTAIGYTLVVTNNGPGTALGATVTDTLPAEVTFVSAVPSQGSCSGTTSIVCTLGTLATGANATIAIVVQSSSALPASNPIMNDASVSAITADPEPGNNVTSQPTTIVAQTDLQITKSAPATVTAGNSLVYTMTVTNAGPSDAENVSVTDLAPFGLTLTSATPSTGSCSGTATIVCALGTVPAGQTRTITATFAVPSGYVAPTPIVNNATVSSSTTETNPSNNTATAFTTLVRDADVSITKVGPPSIAAGATISYTLVITNNGPSDATAVQVADLTPPNLTFVGNTGACTTPFPCSLGTLTPGETRTIVSQFTVPSGYTTPTPIVNTATVSTTTPDSNSANNSATATTTLGPPSADLSVTKVAPATAIPGNPIVYTITVTNNGPADAAGVSLADPTPTGLTFVSNAGACVTAFPCALGVVPSGQTRTITSTFMVPPGYTLPDPISNTATVSATTTDPNPANNTATALTSVGADLSLTKTASSATAAAGDVLTYTLVSTNGGARDAVDLVITDPLPSGTTFVSASTSTGGACATPAVGSAGTVTCTWAGATPMGVSRTLTLVLRMNQGLPIGTPIANSATTSSLTNDPAPANNAAAVSATTTIAADIVLTKTVDNRQPRGGQLVTFTVTARNAGPSDATGVQVVDQMPFGLTYVSSTASQGTFDPASGLWTIGALANGASATLQVGIQATAPGALTNIATKIAADQADPNSSNNIAGEAVGVWDPADVRIQVHASTLTPTVGETVTFTIAASNHGPDPITNVQVLDQLPAGLTFVSASASAAGGSYEADTGMWSVPAIAVGDTATLTLSAMVAQGGPITNVARKVAQDVIDPAPGNDSDGVTINGDSADVAVVTTLDRRAPVVGEVVTFTIAVANNGSGRASGVRVRDVLPAGLTFASASVSQGTYVPETGVWTVGALDAPGSGDATNATLQLHAIVTAAGSITNTATVVGGDLPDPAPANDASSVTLGGLAGSLRGEVQVNGDASQVGNPITFIVRATNAGQVDLRGPFTAVLPFPDEVAFASSDQNVTCQTIGRVVSCTRSGVTLATAQHIEIAFHGTVTRPFAPGGLAVFGSVFSAEDRTPGDNVSAALIGGPASATADVHVTQTATATVQAGGARKLTYAIAVANAGPGAATGITLQDVVPPGLTVSSIASSQGACDGNGVSGATLMCEIGALAPGASATVTVTGEAAVGQQVAHLVTASGREADPDSSNNAALDVQTDAPVLAADRDTDGDGMPDVWESRMGLDPGVNDAAADPDHDGVSNLDEFRAGTHPRGTYKQFFAEGVSNGFFGTMFSLLNPSPTRDAAVAIELMRDNGTLMTTPMQLGAMKRYDAGAREMLGTWEGSFATLIESDQPLATDRLTWWDARGYGTGLEEGQPATSTRWLFAEGATHGFQLFFLLQNPDMTQAADVTIRYLLPSGPPVVKTYQVAPHSRLTILANDIPGLTATDVSAEILSTRPIVAERAMYRNTVDQLFAAGHVGAGATAPGTTWLFAEGATGAFFNLYLLLGNPGALDANVDVRYLLPDGQTILKSYVVAGNTRRTIDVAAEDQKLAGTSVGMTVTSTQPIVAERAMWWPGPLIAPAWYEAHVVLGATEAGIKWAVASGAAGGALGDQTFVLVANQATAAGRLRVTAILDDGTTQVQELPIAATARVTLEIATLFPSAANHTFSIIVESIGATPVPIVVEGARYASPGGQLWGAGAAALGTRLQ